MNCGLVVSDLCLERQEPFVKTRDGRYVRVSERVIPENIYPHSTLSPNNKDCWGSQISNSMEQLFDRFRLREKQFKSNHTRNLIIANQIRCRILSTLGFTDPKKISWGICQWVAKTGFSQGRKLEATTIAAIYVAAIEQNFPVTYEQLSEISHVRPDHLRHIVTIYLSRCPGSKHIFPLKFTQSRFFSPDRYIRKLCNDLHYPPRITTLAENLAQTIEGRFPTGHRPETKAAVYVNIACGGIIPWKHLARASGVQIPSLKGYWHKIESIVFEILHTNSPYIQEALLNIC